MPRMFTFIDVDMILRVEACLFCWAAGIRWQIVWLDQAWWLGICY